MKFVDFSKPASVDTTGRINIVEGEARCRINTIMLIGFARMNGEVILRAWFEIVRGINDYDQGVCYCTASISMAQAIWSDDPTQAYLYADKKWFREVSRGW